MKSNQQKGSEDLLIRINTCKN